MHGKDARYSIMMSWGLQLSYGEFYLHCERTLNHEARLFGHLIGSVQSTEVELVEPAEPVHMGCMIRFPGDIPPRQTPRYKTG